MPISDWFKAREERRYIAAPNAPVEAGDVPEGVWVHCEGCKKTLYAGDLEKNVGVCPNCGRHEKLTAPERIVLLVDEGSLSEIDADLRSGDPLHWTSGKSYAGSLQTAAEATGLDEAVITGRAAIGGRPVVVGAFDFRFIGASMGSVVGEKVTRALELAAAERRPLVLAIASGGARMQEGMLSLMQMAKTSAAAARLADAGVPYIAILTNPTYGGVTASFATLADVIVAEPGADIGFAGKRLVEQTMRGNLPKGFQTSEALLQHGMVDMIVDRGALRDTVALLLDYLVPAGEAS